MKYISTASNILNADLREHSARCAKHCPHPQDWSSHVKIKRYPRDKVLRKLLVREMRAIVKREVESQNDI